ncbi:MAG: division/cell wall cluster transcriptional repressor MraZ [Patescibacteria group bacterium]|jgi:MraZ protein
MLLGHYQSNFDKEKGRISIPKVFTKQLGEEVIITKGYEGSLLIVSRDDWNTVISQVAGKSFLSGLSRQTDRFLLGNAFEIKIDSQGRFVVPPKLREYAKLGKEVLFVGVGNRVEVWDKQAWEQNEQYLNENIAQISETLNDKLSDTK